jgi:hypothetical protein
VLLVVFMTVDTAHDRAPCARCVAEWPADPAAAVQRWRGLLWYHHVSTRWWYHLGTVVLLVGVFVSQMWWLCLLLLLLSSMVTCRAKVRHRQTFLWCPYCRVGGGWGGVVPAGAPDPLVWRPR